MNVALIHEQHVIKSFWEQRIEKHTQVSGTEETRMKNSALAKLRDEWLWRLEKQNKHLKSFNEERMKKTKPEKQLEEIQQREEKKAREADGTEDIKETDAAQQVENMEEMEQNDEEKEANFKEQEVADGAEATKEMEVSKENVETETKHTEENVEVTQNGVADLEEMLPQKPEMEIEPSEQE